MKQSKPLFFILFCIELLANFICLVFGEKLVKVG